MRYSRNTQTKQIIDPKKKDRKDLDITLPILMPSMHMEWSRLQDLEVEHLKFDPIALHHFSEEECRKITFIDVLNPTQESHSIVLSSNSITSYHFIINSIISSLVKDLKIVSRENILFDKIKIFIECNLFGQHVNLEDENVLKNLAEPMVRSAIIEIFKRSIRELILQPQGSIKIERMLRISETKSYNTKGKECIIPIKSMFNYINGDSCFELDFARFLERCNDIIAYVKNSQAVGFCLDYLNDEGRIASYYPDFIVKQTENNIWIIELKGLEDLNTANKRSRLMQYCNDAMRTQDNYIIKSLYIKQNKWDSYRPRNFTELVEVFSG